MSLVPQKINDLDPQAELLDTHQLETDIGGVTPGKITGLQLKQALKSVSPSDTLRVEPGVGSDVTGDGTAQNPYETYDFAMSTLSPGGLKLILTEGSGVVDQNINITRDFTFLIATGIVLSPSSGHGVTINAPGANTIGYRIGGIGSFAGNSINIVSANATAGDVPAISGDIVANEGIHLISSLQFNGGVSGPGLIYINDVGGGSSASPDIDTLFGRSKDKWYGSMIFNGRTRIRRKNGIIITGNVNITELHAGSKIYTDSVNPIGITLPQESTLVLPDFWESDFVRSNTGAVTFVTEGSDILIGSASIASVGGKATASVLKTVGGVRTWVIEQ
jgi:hypothetical protein